VCDPRQGGYFVVNGSEKVLIAQERMANNHVAVYKKRDHKYSTVAEARCVPCMKQERPLAWHTSWFASAGRPLYRYHVSAFARECHACPNAGGCCPGP
jgi:RNA polymerase beta subunit